MADSGLAAGAFDAATRAGAKADAVGVKVDGSFSPRTKRRKWSVMASPPTITYGAEGAGLSTVNPAGTSTAPTIAWNSDAVSLIGGVLTQSAGVPGTYFCSNTQQSNTLRGGIMVVRFITDSAKFDFLTRGSGRISLIVNGEIQSLAGISLNGGGATANGKYYFVVDFGSAAVREVEIIFSIGAYWAGMNVLPGYSTWAWPAKSRRLMIVGDSYTAEQTVDYPGGGYAYQAGRIMGYDDIWVSGVGGTGYLADAAATAPKLRNRLASDIMAYAPDDIIVCMGINDYNQNEVALGAEVSLFYAALFAALPNARVVAFGPWAGTSVFGNKTQLQTRADAIKAAVQADPRFGVRLFYVDTFAQNYQFGDGRTLQFTADLSGATSATMVSTWFNTTQTRTVVFSDGSTRTAQFTNNSAGITWTGAITATKYGSTYASDGGNSQRYIHNDGTHPVQPGYDYLAQRVAFDAARALGISL